MKPQNIIAQFASAEPPSIVLNAFRPNGTEAEVDQFWFYLNQDDLFQQIVGLDGSEKTYAQLHDGWTRLVNRFPQFTALYNRTMATKELFDGMSKTSQNSAFVVAFTAMYHTDEAVESHPKLNSLIEKFSQLDHIRQKAIIAMTIIQSVDFAGFGNVARSRAVLRSQLTTLRDPNATFTHALIRDFCLLSIHLELAKERLDKMLETCESIENDENNIPTTPRFNPN